MYNKLSSPVGLGRNQTAILDIPRNGYQNRWDLEISGGISVSSTTQPMTLAQFSNAITEIRVKLNGRTIQEFSGDFLNKINAYFGKPNLPGIFQLHFLRPWMYLIPGQESSRIAAHIADSLTLEVDFNANYYPTQMDVRAYHELPSADPNENAFGYREITRQSKSHSSIGIQEISDIVIDGANLHAICFVDAVADTGLGDIEIQSGGVIIHESSRKSREVLRQSLGRTEQDDMTVIDFAEKNLWGNAYPLIEQDLRIRLDWEQLPGAFDIYLDKTSVREFRSFLPRGGRA